MEAVFDLRATIEDIQNRSKPYSNFKDFLNLSLNHHKIALLLYYLSEYYTVESIHDIHEIAKNELYNFHILDNEDLDISLAKNAFASAVEFWYLDLAEAILYDKLPPILDVTILKLFQKNEISLLRTILGLDVYVQGIKKSNSSRDLVKMVRGLFEDRPDGPQKIRVCDIIEYGIQQNIPMSTIMKLCVECKDLDDGSAINALLCRGKEEEALILLGQYGNSINSKSLLQALNAGCFKFAVEFAGRQRSIKGSASRIFSFLFRKLGKQLPEEIGNIEIYLYILRKYIESADLDDAIHYADAIDSIVKQEFVEEHFWKFFNPIKIIALLIEITKIFDSQFPAMMMRFKKIIDDLNSIGTDILSEIKVDSIMKFVLYDKDLENRDTIGIILENHIIDFLNNAIVEKIANEVWSGPFDFAKNPLQPTSSLLKMITHHKLFGDKDVEVGLRNKLFDRDIEIMRTHKLEYEVWRMAAGLRVLFIGLEYIALTVGLFTFELSLRDAFNRMDAVWVIPDQEGRDLNEEEYAIYYTAIVDCKVWTFWWDLDAISILIGASRCLTLPLFCYLTGRGKKWISMEWFINFIMVILLLAMYIPWRPDKEILGFEHIMMEGEALVKKVEEMQDDDYTSILTALIAFGLGLRIMYLLRYTNFLGPMITILVSMIRKILEFGLFYFIVLFVFALSATLLFPAEEPGFDSIENIVITLFQNSIGVFDLNPPEKYMPQAKIFYVLFVFVVNIMLLNFVVAILNDVYAQMSPKSKSTLHKEIISLRDQYKPNKYYQFMVSSYFIFDVTICIMFLPIFPFLSKSGRITLNKCLLIVEYSFAFIIMLPFYFALELLLVPVAFLAAVMNKILFVWKKRREPYLVKRIMYTFLFLIYGVPLMLFCAILDTYTFTIGCFSHKPSRRLDKEANDYAPADVMKDVIDFLKDFVEEEVKFETVVKGIETLFSKESNPDMLKKVVFKSISNILWIAQYATITRYIRLKSRNDIKGSMVNVRYMRTVFSRILRLHLLRRHVRDDFPEPKNIYTIDSALMATIVPQNKSFLPIEDTSKLPDNFTPSEKQEYNGNVFVAAFKVYDPEVYKKGIEKYVAREAITTSMAIQVRTTAELVQKLCNYILPQIKVTEAPNLRTSEKYHVSNSPSRDASALKGSFPSQQTFYEETYLEPPGHDHQKNIKKVE